DRRERGATLLRAEHGQRPVARGGAPQGHVLGLNGSRRGAALSAHEKRRNARASREPEVRSPAHELAWPRGIDQLLAGDLQRPGLHSDLQEPLVYRTKTLT